MTAEPPSAQFKPRRSPRTRVSGTAALRQHNDFAVEVRIRDVSTEGFMAQCPDPVRIGSYVAIEVAGIGPVRAQVRWQLGDRMGGQFEDPISLSRCDWAAAPRAPGRPRRRP
jgi:hypothetical protein